MAHLISMHFVVMPDLGFINECQDHMIVLVTLIYLTLQCLK